MQNNKKTLGILGGMGPLATAHFYEMLTRHTSADCDADHLNIIITSTADIPDRTDFIMGQSEISPAPVMCRDAGRLEAAGADVIAIPCNTAHYFHEEIDSSVNIRVLNIVKETAEHVSRRGFRHAGILGTVGTLKIGAYKRELAKFGVECIEPPEHIQTLVTSVIYDYVKAGKRGGEAVFERIADYMFELGCDCLILGCTELPLVSPENDPRLIDSLETLAYASITACGGTPTGFSPEFMSIYGEK